MEQHKRFTGLPYDPVFVFPQGRFSSVAIKALKDQGYFAAFNSTIRATDRGELPPLEYQRPATRIYHDFPLFLRRYLKNKEHFEQDVESGRPIIVVEHHGVFRNGYETMTDFVDWVNGLGNITWTSLSHIAEHYLGNKVGTTCQAATHHPLCLRSRVKVACRRFLCEARDKYVETDSLLFKAYKHMRG